MMIKPFLKNLSIFITLATLLTFSTSGIAAEKPLYDRLGGYDALAAVVDDLMGRLVADQQVGRVLEHISDSRFNHIRQLMVDFLCVVTGGPCK